MEKRIRTNAEIDVLNQFLSEGEAPLPYENPEENQTTENNPPKEIKQPENILTDEQKAEQEKIKADAIGAQKIIDDNQKEIDSVNDEKKKEILSQQQEKEKVAPLAPELELTDEQVLAYIKKAKGKEISSLDEFINPPKQLSEEEKKLAAQKREDAMFAYGLSNGIFTKNELSDFIKDTANPTDLVFEAYAADQKAKDPELTDKEIKEEFDEKFGLSIEDKEDRHYIAGQRLINKIAEGLINAKYSKIKNLDKDYSAYETSTSKQKELDAKIAAHTPIYKNELAQIKSSIKKVPVPINENETFELVLEDDVINEVIEEMSSENFSKGKLQDGWDKDNLKQVAITTGIMKSLSKLLNDYGDKVKLDTQAGLRGIKPDRKEEGRQRVAGELTENQKKALAMIDEMSLAN